MFVSSLKLVFECSLDDCSWPVAVAKPEVFETAQTLNSRVNPTTSTPKMAPGRYDPVYEEGGQDYPLPYRCSMAAMIFDDL